MFTYLSVEFYVNRNFPRQVYREKCFVLVCLRRVEIKTLNLLDFYGKTFTVLIVSSVKQTLIRRWNELFFFLLHINSLFGLFSILP